MAGAVVRPSEAVRSAAVPLLLVASALALFTLGLGHGSLWDQDEARYTEIARQIVERGDPLTLYSDGSPWFVHPPFYLWLQALTGRLFGFSEWTARIWTAVFGTAGIVVTFLLGRRLYDARTGVLAGVILMTTLEWFALSRLAIFDVVLVTFMLLTIYMVVVGLDVDGPSRRRAFRWALVWAGLGTLTKGPIALLLPAMVVGAWWLIGHRGRLWRALPWEGVLLYAAIGLSWYVAQLLLHGEAFLRSAVGYYMVNRFLGVVENQAGPWYYYGPVLLVGAFPWTAFLPGAAVYHWRRRGDARSLLVLLGPGITLLFYSLAGTKLPNYILPLYPLAALGVARLWAAHLWEDSVEAARLLAWGFGAVLATVAFLAAAVAWFGRFRYPEALAALGPHLRSLAVLLIVGLGAATALFAARRRPAAFLAVPATMALLFVALILSTLPKVEALRPVKPLAARIVRELRPGDIIVGMGIGRPASLTYYTRHAVRWASDVQETRAAVCLPGRALVVTLRGASEDRVRASLPNLRRLAVEGDLVLLVETADPCPAVAAR